LLRLSANLCQKQKYFAVHVLVVRGGRDGGTEGRKEQGPKVGEKEGRCFEEGLKGDAPGL